MVVLFGERKGVKKNESVVDAGVRAVRLAHSHNEFVDVWGQINYLCDCLPRGREGHLRRVDVRIWCRRAADRATNPPPHGVVDHLLCALEMRVVEIARPERERVVVLIHSLGTN